MIGGNPTLEAALAYAASGWPVFPCKPWPSKAPLTAHGYRDATTDPAKIREWWRRWPGAIIGTPTGSRFVVLDVDPRHRGIETLAGFGFSEAIEAPTVETPGGGWHFYLAPPDPPIRGTVGATGRRGIGAGLDWRARGNYVILPSPGSGYSWVADTRELSFAPVPAALMPREPEFADAVGEAREASVLDPYGAAALASAIENIRDAPEGAQRSTLNGECFSIGRLAGAGGVPAALALLALTEAARELKNYDQSRPWRPGQAEEMARTAFREGRARPRLSLEEKQRALDEAVDEMVRTGVDIDWDPGDG
jgi:hypothetical protein